jgi:ankyrin repeat protein
MSFQLPPNAHLEHLRGQAKALQRAHAAGDADARRRIAALRELRDVGTLTLAAAQLAIARGYGFASWAKLKHHLERARESAAQREDAFLAAACGGDASQARQILAEWPQVASASIVAACAAGDAEAVLERLARDPGLAVASGGPKGWTPLLYLCWSSLLAGGRRAVAVATIARELLARGADPNATYVERRHGPPYTESALSGACGTVADPVLVRTLLAGGARPDDNAFSNAIAHRDTACVEALVEHGYALSGQRLHHQLDSECPHMLRWLLAHGGDPDAGAPQDTALHWAIKRGRSREVIALLLTHGANVEARIARGHTQFPTVVASTPLELAIRCLHRDAIELLLEHGARLDALSPTDRVLLACARGEETAARAALEGDGDALRSHPELCGPAMVNAAAGGNATGVTLLLACGCPPVGRGWMDGGPLHQAALNGHAAVVASLLHHRARVDDRENHHRSTPLSWAEYGSLEPMNPSGRYAEVAELLIAAGSPLPAVQRGSPAVREVLGRHGVPPAPPGE